MLPVFDLMRFPQVPRRCLDVHSLLSTLVLSSLDVCLELGLLDLSLIHHASGFHNGSVDCTALVRQVFVTLLEVLDVLLQDLDLSVLVVHLGFVIPSHSLEAVLQQVASLLDICDLQSQ
jgi:hypothetical protein